jgi:hypothetical protein
MRLGVQACAMGKWRKGFWSIAPTELQPVPAAASSLVESLRLAPPLS